MYCEFVHVAALLYMFDLRYGNKVSCFYLIVFVLKEGFKVEKEQAGAELCQAEHRLS